MTKEKLDLVRGTGNVYQDFDIADADTRQLKALLAAKIIKKLDKDKITVREAQKITDIDAGDFSRVRNADFRRISVERLTSMINRLGSRVEFEVKLKPVRRRVATQQASHAMCA